MYMYIFFTFLAVQWSDPAIPMFHNTNNSTQKRNKCNKITINKWICIYGPQCDKLWKKNSI